jgi:hypothetical protein
VGLKLNGRDQSLAYVDGVNLLGDNIRTIKKNTETLIYINKGVGLIVNVETTTHMLLPCHQKYRAKS